jgi:putative endonuclease
LYTGWTTNLDQRITMHNAGQGARYTKGRLPVKLVYHETHPDRRSAMKREREIKKLSRVQKMALFQ